MNEGEDLQDGIPAAYDEVLTATAVWDNDGAPGGLGSGSFPFPQLDVCLEFDDVAAAFSNFATLAADRAHAIAAPGVCINSTSTDGGASLWWIGTSFAAPHVAGVAALCLSSGACAGLAPHALGAKLLADAEKFNTTRGKSYGFVGDPLRPTAGRYYGYLVRASQY